MIAVCKLKCQFRGRTVHRGMEFDILPREVDDRVRASFVPSSGTWDDLKMPDHAPGDDAPEAPAPDAKDSLTNDELRRRLTEMGVAFKARDGHATLMELYLAQVNQTPGE